LKIVTIRNILTLNWYNFVTINQEVHYAKNVTIESETEMRKKASRTRRFSFIGLSLLLFFCLLFTLPTITANDGKVRVYFFFSESCEECRFVKEIFLPQMQQKYQGILEVKPFEISSIENFEMLLALEKNYHRKIDKTPPLMLIGEDVLEGKDKIQAQLEQVIEKYRQSGGCDWPTAAPVPVKDKHSAITGKFKELTLAAVIGGGLLDGINPCAFTTLIFLISYLSLVGRKGKQLIISGAIFTVGVFIAYFLIGYGLLELFTKVPFFKVIGRIFSYFLAGVLGLLGFLSLYDYFLVRKGKLKETTLQLSENLKLKIHAIIRKRSRSKYYLVASFVMGFLVALVEFPCTGQIYFPIIFVLRESSAFKVAALSYLAVYNLMFVLPLIGVFCLVYWGVTSDQIGKIMLKNVGGIKLLTALLFWGLAVLMIFLG
jgi:cytochrome c biogenesis protein CcdA